MALEYDTVNGNARRALGSGGGRYSLLAGLAVLMLFAPGCARTWNPWLSPTQIEVKGECAIFTGRIVPGRWGGKPIATMRGVRYRTPSRPVRLPTTVRILIVEALQAGSCSERPNLQKVPDRGVRAHFLTATFKVIQPKHRGEKGVQIWPLPADYTSIVREKHSPWPYWPWTHYSRMNIAEYFLDVHIPRPPDRALQLQVCVAGKCSAMKWRPGSRK